MKYALRPTTKDEVNLFYTNSDNGRDVRLGTVGHLRADFDTGRLFYTTWWPHNDDKLNTSEFKAEFEDVVKSLRRNGLLKDLDSMQKYCFSHADGAIDNRAYGYIVESDNYRYCLRCTPYPGEYHAYIYIYDKRRQE